MPNLSFLIPEMHQNVSSGYAEMLVQSQREELCTGLMRMRHSSGDDFVMSFVEGAQQKLYRCIETGTEILPRSAWPPVNRSDVSVGILNLSIEAARFMRVAFDAPVLRVDQFLLHSQDLTEKVGEWAIDNSPSVVRVHGENIDKYYLFADRSNSVLEEISFRDGQAQFSIADTSFPKILPPATYQVTRYVSDPDHEVWCEFKLRLAFSPFMQILMKRFGELAGKVLTERLCENLSSWVRGGGWDINLSSNGVMNRHYFESLDDAVSAYADIINRFQFEASPAIGQQMAEGLLRESATRLDPIRRDLLKKYIFDRHGFGGALPRA